MSTSSVRHLFPQLLSNGYVPIPNRDKVCMLPKWSTIEVDERRRGVDPANALAGHRVTGRGAAPGVRSRPAAGGYRKSGS